MCLPEGIPSFTPGRLRSNWNFRTQNFTSSAQPLLKPASAGTSTAGWRHLEATSVSAVPSHTKRTAPYRNTLPILSQYPHQEVIPPPGGAQDTPFSHSSMLTALFGNSKIQSKLYILFSFIKPETWLRMTALPPHPPTTLLCFRKPSFHGTKVCSSASPSRPMRCPRTQVRL